MTQRWPHIRGVLFDKDGTLLDYWRTWLPINREIALAAAKGDRALADQLLLAGGHDPVTDKVVPGSVLSAAGADGIADTFAKVLGPRTPKNLLAIIDRIFAEGGAKHAVAIDGAREAVLAIKRKGIVVGLATNDSEGGMKASLARTNLADLFEFQVAADSGFGAKPGPGMALEFARSTGIAPSHLCAVGDSIHDLHMAHGANYGLKVAVLTGPAGRSDLAPAADVVLDDVRGLVDLFRS